MEMVMKKNVESVGGKLVACSDRDGRERISN